MSVILQLGLALCYYLNFIVTGEIYSCHNLASKDLNPMCVRDFAFNLTKNLSRGIDFDGTLLKINDILNVPKSVHRESQSKYQSSQLILEGLDDLVDYNLYSEAFTYYQTENIIVAVFDYEETIGIVVYNEDNNRQIEQIRRNSSVADLLLHKNYEFAAYLNLEAFDIDESYAKMIILYVDSLFYDLSDDNITNKVAVKFMNIESDSLTILYNVDKYWLARECSYWNTEFNGWHREQTDLTCSKIQKCEHVNNQEVYYSLIVNSTENCIEHIVKNLSNINKRSASIRSTLVELNDIMEGPKTTLRLAQTNHNTTDAILDRFDVLLTEKVGNKDFELIEKKNLVVQMFSITKSDVVGISVYKNGKNRKIKPIYKNSTLTDVVFVDDFYIAAYLPPLLIETINKTVENPKVIITIFFKDSLFVEQETKHATSGVAFGVLVPGFNESFKVPLKIAYNVDGANNKECAHWFYGASVKGSWKPNRPASLCGKIDICDYHHLTHFAMLILESVDELKLHKTTLETITFVGSILSIIGYSIIYLTAFLFRKWRQSKGNIILINYSVASEMMIIILYISEHVKEMCDDTWCFWSGVLLHYTVLAQFFWILVISYIQYQRYVHVLGFAPNWLLVKSCLVGWGAPLPIVYIVALLANESYVRSSNLCYPSGLALYLGVLLPILIIVIINVIIFILILRAIFEKRGQVTRDMKHIIKLRLRLIILLFFQLGLTWIFGFLGTIHIVFIYLFCITGTIQGFIVFLIFIVFNEYTSSYYKELSVCQQKGTYAVSSAELTSLSK